MNFLSNPSLLSLVGGIILAVATIPGGVAQQLLVAIINHIASRLPASQYVLLKALALDVVAGVHQFAEAQGLDNPARKAMAVSKLTALAKAHGISRYDIDAVALIVEQAWATYKATLPASTPVVPAVPPVLQAPQNPPSAL